MKVLATMFLQSGLKIYFSLMEKDANNQNQYSKNGLFICHSKG